MFKPGDLTFKSAESWIVKQEDGSYVDVNTKAVCSNFSTWYRKTSGPYEITFDPEEYDDPADSVRNAIGYFKTCKTMEAKFMRAEEAFYVCSKVPEVLVMYRTELSGPIMEMAMSFLLYDDIAAHPVWLHCAQEAVKLCRAVNAGEV
jgi:hypothetical protein